MSRIRLVLKLTLLFFWLLGPIAAQAQEETATPTPTDTPTATFTPSDTPTPTITPTPTPNVMLLFTLQPPDATLEGPPGTPAPGHPASFALRADAGQLLINLLLGGILFTVWIDILVRVFKRGGPA